jgi:hypothetical protein
MGKSAYSDYHAMIIKPVNGGLITLRDQRALGERIMPATRRHYYSIHFAVDRRNEVLALLRNAKLSKPMRVIEISEAQFSRRYQLPETIEGTGIRATAKQIDDSFIIGK